MEGAGCILQGGLVVCRDSSWVEPVQMGWDEMQGQIAVARISAASEPWPGSSAANL